MRAVRQVTQRRRGPSVDSDGLLISQANLQKCLNCAPVQKDYQLLISSYGQKLGL